MRCVFIPLLLLAGVAITSTTTLPLMTASKLDANTDDDGQQTDNISYTNSLRDILQNIIYKIPDDTNKNQSPEKTARYGKTNNERPALSLDDFITQENAYNDEGFRKEQWHNYPRRLDRLQEYIISSKNLINQIATQHDNDNILDQYKSTRLSDRSDKDIETNEFELNTTEDPNNLYDSSFSATSPILILKIRLACLKNQYKNVEPQNYDDNLLAEDLEKGNFELGLFDNEMSPVSKVKREDATSEGSSTDEEQTKKKTVSKRLFSLWSRLQSLSHKGHELPHRRHMAFYHMPEGGAGADSALNTQTRALMRPPGSPLRWG